MSAPASRLDQRLARQHRDGLVVDDDAVAQEPVMAMAGVGIERHVAEHADLRHGLLDRPDGAADEIVRVERLAAVLVAQLGVGIGKQREAGNAERGRALGVAHGLVDREPLDARHRRHRHARLRSIDQEQRPDQVVESEHGLGHQPARPVGLAIAAGRTERSSRAAFASTGARRASIGRPYLIAMATLLSDAAICTRSKERLPVPPI